MGLHYVNFPLVLDGELDVTQPGDRHLRAAAERKVQLIGADYLVFADAWHAKHTDEPPKLGGTALHLFESPNRFGLPAFYTLHVWAWKDSPTGHVRELAPQGVVRRVRRPEGLSPRQSDPDRQRPPAASLEMCMCHQ